MEAKCSKCSSFRGFIDNSPKRPALFKPNSEMGAFRKIFLLTVTVLAVVSLASGAIISIKELWSRTVSQRCAVQVQLIPNIRQISYAANDLYLKELKRKHAVNFRRISKTGTLSKKYITSKGIDNTWNDPRIFRETQIKRILRSKASIFVSPDVKNKLAYFSENEDLIESRIYMNDTVTPKLEKGYAIHNIGHSTVLIQVPGLNILTDPVFGHLSATTYPQKTKSLPDIEGLPQIDVILISHNHRDHVDKPSLRDIVEYQKRRYLTEPLVLVPLGDKLKFKLKFWYTNVIEVDWFMKIQVAIVRKVGADEKGEPEFKTNFISIPANHRSGRRAYDNLKSLVMGWAISPEDEDVVIKYSGDTAPLAYADQEAVNRVLWHEIKYHKTKNVGKVFNREVVIPRIILLEPSGPNFTQKDMIRTHQPASYSALLIFFEARDLAEISDRTIEDILERMVTIMIHQNKYELGPDRFNEGIFVVEELLNILRKCIWGMTEEKFKACLVAEEEEQKKILEAGLDRKEIDKLTKFTSWPLLTFLPKESSLLIHAHDFVVRDINMILNERVLSKLKGEYFSKIEYIIKILFEKTLFPKIGQRLDDNNLNSAKRFYTEYTRDGVHFEYKHYAH